MPVAPNRNDRERPHGFRIRTITAGLQLESPGDRDSVDHALRFLQDARRSFEAEGHEVQTVRLATQPWAPYLSQRKPSEVLEEIRRLDATVAEADALLSVGPLITDDRSDPGFAAWAAELAESTGRTSFSVTVASPEIGLHPAAARTAAETMRAVSGVGSNGEANFRFAAAANVAAGTPFFPVAYHAGQPSFALGLESAGLVGEAFAKADLGSASAALAARLAEALAPVEEVAVRIAERTSCRFLGLDVSPAPGLDASIAAAIERLTGEAFGEPSTLVACAAVTQGLDRLQIAKCGYCGLMLPVLEDRLLARRAAEGRYGVDELLLYSSVSGTGLDVVPLAGGVSVDSLSGVILDVAALATKLGKPLAARLLPIPGKEVGDKVSFDNPHLTDARVMALG